MTSQVPEGGWRASSFTGTAALRLRNDLLMIHRVGSLSGIRRVTPKLAKIFRWQRKKILAEFERRYFNFVGRRKSAKAAYEIELNPGQHEGLWAEALDAVLLESGLEFEQVIRSSSQSVADVVYQGTSLALGTTTTQLTQAALNARVARLAADIVGILETTRIQFRELLSAGIFEDQLTVAQMVSRIADSPVSTGFSLGRVVTIARTEMGQAADEARKQSISDSGTVTHVSVIGCEAREPNSPRYRGESTCNATDIPIGDMNQLVFHPNHTGTIVPSRFLDVDPPILLPPDTFV